MSDLFEGDEPIGVGHLDRVLQVDISVPGTDFPL